MPAFKYLFVALMMVVGANAQAAPSKGSFGLQVGMGVPYMQQAGLNYQFNDSFGMAFNYNLFDISIGSAGAKLAMPELLFNYHPFAGSFFIGAGVGQQTLNVKASSTTGPDVKIDVTSTSGIAKLGWMWGIGNRGFWFGMDVAFVSPSNSESKVTAPGVPVTDQSYIDAQDSAKKFGETAYTNLTFARFGWLF